MNIETKTIGELIDGLAIANIGCWAAQDILKDGKLDPETRLNAAFRAQRLNKRRCELVAAIDRRLGERVDPTTDKTY